MTRRPLRRLRQATCLAVELLYLEILREMCDNFDRFMDRTREQRPSSLARDAPTIAIAYGLCCHAYEVVRHSLPVFETGSIASVPLLRAVFETGVTAQWLRNFAGAEVTLMTSHSRLEDALTEDMAETPLEQFQAAAKVRPGQGPELPTHPEAPSSSKVEAMCRMFEGGEQLYVYYRILCGYTHPGVRVADEWLELEPDRRAGVSFRRVPRNTWSDHWLYLGVIGLSWASRAYDDMIKGSPRANFLNRIGRRMDLNTRLIPIR